MGRNIAVVLAGVAVAGGLFAIGRESADVDRAHRDGGAEGLAAGLRAGRAAGLREGRALEVGDSLPRGSQRAAREAFDAGYTAGANDVFGGFDGGWSLSTPYVITVRKGSGPITYRLDSRRPVRPPR